MKKTITLIILSSAPYLMGQGFDSTYEFSDPSRSVRGYEYITGPTSQPSTASSPFMEPFYAPQFPNQTPNYYSNQPQTPPPISTEPFSRMQPYGNQPNLQRQTTYYGTQPFSQTPSFPSNQPNFENPTTYYGTQPFSQMPTYSSNQPNLETSTTYYGSQPYTQTTPSYSETTPSYSQMTPSYSETTPSYTSQPYYQTPQGQYSSQYSSQPQGYSTSSQQMSGRYFDTTQGYAGSNQPQTTSQKFASDQDISKKVHADLTAGWFWKGYPNVSYDIHNGVVTLMGSVETQNDRNKLEERIKKIDGVTQVNNQVTVSGKSINQARTQNAQQGYFQRPETSTSQGGYYQTGQGQGQGYSTVPMYQQNVNQQSMMDQDMSKMGTTTSESTTQAQQNYPQDYALTDADRQLNSTIRDSLRGWFSDKYNRNITIRTSNGVVTLTGTVDKPEDLQKINDDIKNVDGMQSVNNQITVKNQ